MTCKRVNIGESAGILCTASLSEPGETECREAIWSEGRSCRKCRYEPEPGRRCYRSGWPKKKVDADNERLCNSPDPLADREYEHVLFLELLRIGIVNHDEEWTRFVADVMTAYDSGSRGIKLTIRDGEHPEGLDIPCLCQLCRSYGD